MKALVFGVDPEPGVAPLDPDNPLLAALAVTPMRSVDVDDPGFLRPDWVVTRPRLTGICGSDAKQVFIDWGRTSKAADNPMIDFSSFPQILGHEVVADVVALGPEAEGLDVGDRVVLNPWLSCAPRGCRPLCPACEIGDLSLCWNFTDGPIAPGHPHRHVEGLPGGWADLMPAHDSMLFKVPDSMPDELAVFADPFAVSLHAVTRHAPHAGRARCSCTAPVRSARARSRSCARLYPDVEVGVVARFAAQARWPSSSARTGCSRTSRRSS